MGILDWLFGSPKFTRFEDSFAMTQASLWLSLRTAIETQQQAGQHVWIVTHFADTFASVQELLAKSGLEYQIVNRPLQPQNALSILEDDSGQIQLALAELLVPAQSAELQFSPSLPLSMIVVERHPQLSNDQRLEAFARSLPCPVRFGYYLSIEDVVVRRVVNENMIQIIKLLGMKDHELVSSIMLTRRLEKVLREEAKRNASNERADSAAEWYEVNG